MLADRVLEGRGLSEKYPKIGAKMILKESWKPLDRAGIEAKALGTRNQFGVEEILESNKYDSRKLQSTSLLVADNVGDAMHCLWPIFAKKTGEIPEESASESGDTGQVQGNDGISKYSEYELAQDIILDRRMQVVLYAKTEGKLLTKCSSSWELCESIAHCLLGMLRALNIEV